MFAERGKQKNGEKEEMLERAGFDPAVFFLEQGLYHNVVFGCSPESKSMVKSL